MITTTISDKFQIVIPKNVRTPLGLKVGQKVTMQPLVEQGMVLLMLPSKKTKPWYKQLRGLGKEVWDGIDPVTYVRALRDEWN